MKFIASLMEINIAQADIGIVSPYKLQCKKISQKCAQLKLNNITIGSAEAFQGEERKVMIISTVRARQRFLGDFLSNAQVGFDFIFYLYTNHYS